MGGTMYIQAALPAWIKAVISVSISSQMAWKNLWVKLCESSKLSSSRKISLRDKKQKL